MTITIPNLRNVTLTNNTTQVVPGGETWLIKDISVTSVGTTGSMAYVIINGTTYPIGMTQSIIGDQFFPSFVLQAGETIGCSGSVSTGVKVNYWIISTDFSLPDPSLPALRNITVSRTTDGSTVTTIPGGETWIVQIISVDFNWNSGVPTVSVPIVANSQTLQQLHSFVVTDINGANNYKAGAGFHKKLVMNTGGTITLTLGGGSNTPSVNLKIGYWILETDF